jgi:putative Mg2+ transporter-C (MgtC) family protein
MLQNLTLIPESISSNLLIRLLVACVLGGAIGFERDIHGRAAGLRTNMLVSMGAALFMLLSVAIAQIYSPASESTGLRVDPSRIAAQIVTGIGFLGAGAIIKAGFNIRGLTTAACLWVSAGIGMAAGAGLFEMAILVALIGLFILVIVNRFERIYAKDSYRVLKITVANDVQIYRIIDVVRREHLKILFLDFHRDYGKNQMTITLTIRLFYRGVTDKLAHGIVHDLENCGHPIRNLQWGHK